MTAPDAASSRPIAVPLAPALRVRRRTNFSESELGTAIPRPKSFDLVVPKRTLARRRAGNELLTVEETDKALRLKRIAVQAERVFGDPAKAHRWLRKPKRALERRDAAGFSRQRRGRAQGGRDASPD